MSSGKSVGLFNSSQVTVVFKLLKNAVPETSRDLLRMLGENLHVAFIDVRQRAGSYRQMRFLFFFLVELPCNS